MLDEQCRKRFSFNQLLRKLENNGFLKENLSYMLKAEKQYKFHSIDKKEVTILKQQLKSQDQDIEQLKCKL